MPLPGSVRPWDLNCQSRNCPSRDTASTSHFGGAARVRGLLESKDRKVESVVVYGGDKPQQRSTAAMLPRARLHEHGMGIGVVG